MHLNSAEGEERPQEKIQRKPIATLMTMFAALAYGARSLVYMCIVSGFTNEDLISVTIPILRLRKLRPEGHLKGHLCS